MFVFLKFFLCSHVQVTIIFHYAAGSGNLLDVVNMVCSIKLSNLPALNWAFLPVDVGDSLQKAFVGNMQN